MSWFIAAFLSAFFASITAILAKFGIKNVDSNLATAIRTTVILLFTWGIVFFQGNINAAAQINKTGFIFLILSGLTTGLSWIFYFYALKIGEASKVVPIDKLSLALTIIMAFIFLNEKITLKVVLGSVLMTIGAILIALK